MEGRLAEILDHAQHTRALTTDDYGTWLFQVVPLLDQFLVRYAASHQSNSGGLVAELVAAAIDLADPVHDAQRAQHVMNLKIPLLGSEPFATGPAELFTRIVEILVRARSSARLFGVVLRTVRMPDPASFRVAPLPHGWIIHQHDTASGRIQNVCAVGNCLAHHDVSGVWHGRETSLMCTSLIGRHALLALLESWRLGYDDAQRYLCDLAHAALAAGVCLSPDDFPS